MSEQTPASKRYVDKYFVTRATLDVATKGMAAAVADCINKATQPLHDRIAELEREIERLKQRQPAPSEEWPLRSIQGGKR